MDVVQKVFQRGWNGFVSAHPQPLWVHKAAAAIRTCRTPQRGYHLWACPDGHHREPAANSCGHRACAQCAYLQTERWVRRQLQKLIACDYYHLVFTIPHELHILWRYNRKRFAQLMFDAAWHSLRELLADPRHLGALPGAIGSLHTWQQTLLEHVHLHFLVTAGGIAPDGRWVPVPGKYLIYPRVVAELFRGKFLAYLRKGLNSESLSLPPKLSPQACRSLLNRLDRNRREGKKWHVQIMPRYAHGRGVLRYLSRYVKGGPISQRRILRDEGKQLLIRTKRAEEAGGTARLFRLSTQEFLERFTRHVPPTGMHTVRNYGLFHYSQRQRLAQAAAACGPLSFAEAAASPNLALYASVPGYQPRTCPTCGKPLVVVFTPQIPSPARARAGPAAA